jgi:Arc/MetJ-type ribon-helix-helix transcriptional regulator
MEDSLLFSLKLPRSMHAAMMAAAKSDYCSASDVVRQGLIRLLSERGLMPGHATARPDAADRR